MTNEEAIELLESRMALDKDLLRGDTESEYAKFVLEQNEAIQVALDALKAMNCNGEADKKDWNLMFRAHRLILSIHASSRSKGK